MTILGLKLVLTPALIGGATLMQRRYGPRVGGLPVGLPLTSGPVALSLTLEHGAWFAARSAHATLLGLIAETAFCLTYAISPRRGRRRVRSGGGCPAVCAASARPTYPMVLVILAAAL